MDMFRKTGLALLFAGLGLSAMAFGGEPVLSCNPNLGILPVGKEVTFRAFVENQGQTPLTLVKADSSCPCVSVLDFEPFVEPGKKIPIRLAYKPDREGLSVVELRLETDPPQASPVRLQLMLTAASSERLRQQAIDPQRSISVTELKELTKKGEVIIVDVRDSKDPATFKIPGAINVPLSLLGKLPLPPERQLVIYGSGLNDPQLLQSQNNGKSKIVRGGIRAWMQAGNAVGEASSLDPVLSGMVGLQELIATEHLWMPAVVVSDKQALDGVLPGALVLSSINDLPTRIETLEPADTPVLLLTENGLGYSEIEKILPANLQRPVFYLKGGLPEFLKLQALGVGSKRTVTISSGARDAKGRPVSPAATGCNTCPDKIIKAKEAAQ